MCFSPLLFTNFFDDGEKGGRGKDFGRGKGRLHLPLPLQPSQGCGGGGGGGTEEKKKKKKKKGNFTPPLLVTWKALRRGGKRRREEKKGGKLGGKRRRRADFLRLFDEITFGSREEERDAKGGEGREKEEGASGRNRPSTTNLA